MKKFIQDQYNLENIELKLIQESGSMTYDLKTSDSHYVLKVVSDAFKDSVVDGLKVLDYLQQHNFSSPRIIKTVHDQFMAEDNQKNAFVLYEYEPIKEVKDYDYEGLGKIVGRLHQLMKVYDEPLQIRDKEYYLDRYLNILEMKSYDVEKINRYEALGGYFWRKVKDAKTGFVHGDLHRGNIMDLNQTYFVLDFDTSSIGLRVHDVALICNQTDYFQLSEADFYKTIESFKVFSKGYEKFVQLPSISELLHMIGIYHFQLQANIIEIHGIDCIDHSFIDQQLIWLEKWQTYCQSYL